MTEHLRDKLRRAARAISAPIPPEPSATLRVAVLYSGDGRLGQAAEEAGLDVVYSHDPETHDDYLDFDDIPIFDLVTATVGDRREDVLQFALRFLRIRRPVSFLLTGAAIRPDAEAQFLRATQDKTRRLGYRVFGSGVGGQTFLVGTLQDNPFLWPPGIVPRSEDGNKSETCEGSGEGPLAGFRVPRRPAIPAMAFGGGDSAKSVTQLVMERVAAHIREGR